jgi:hypothetical protein
MNKKNIWNTAVFGTLAILAFSACKKDLGNYSYTQPNTITIATDVQSVDPTVVFSNDSISLKQADTLKMSVVLTQTKPSDSLSYQWMIIQAAANLQNPPLYIIGTSKQLTAKINLSPNLYRLVCKVTDNTTGVSFYKFYPLNVDTSPWGNEGWVVLQDQSADGGCDVSVIATRDGSTGGTIYPNVYSLANGHKLPLGTYKVNVLNYLATLRNQKISFFYPNGGLQVRSTDFADSSSHTSWFLLDPSTINLQLNGVVSGGQSEYLINDKQLYFRFVNSNTIKIPPVLFSPPLLGTWTLAPFVLNNAGSDYYYTLYDQANKCFLMYNVQTNTLIPTGRADIPNSHFVPYAGVATALNPTTGSGFDLNNIGKNMVYAENSQVQTTSNATHSCLFRNNTGDSTWLYQIPVAVAYVNNFTTGRYLLTSAKVPGINTATMFAFPTFLNLPGKFYYVSDNNINTCTIGTLATSASTVGYSFPAGTIIKAMKVFKSGYTTPPASDSKVLVVATDETANGQGNNVYFLNISSTGDISSTPIQVYKGFDKIVDVAFKKGLGQ